MVVGFGTVQGSGAAGGRNQSALMAEGAVRSNTLSLALTLPWPSVLCAARHQLKLGKS